MGLRSRIITVVVVACSIINLFLCFYITEQVRKLELASLRTKIDKAAYVMRLVNTRPLYNVDLETLRVNMETFFDDENMKSIAILESDIDINIHLEREFEPGGMDIHKNFYIYYNGLKLGKISVVYSTSLIEKKLAGFRTKMLWFTFTVILVLAIALVFLINALMKPVTNLAEVASEIAAGNLDKEIEENGVGEVGILS
ncbi:MAG: HAMP domain-containing protein, partial [Desulfobacterales bacterium]|nr:HAMP domain-containing protein [Desulfobacterales bacterium]